MVKLKNIKRLEKFEFYSVDIAEELEVDFVESKVSAGFPSPADDYLELKLDLNKHLIKHPTATFYIKVKGNSMLNAGINDGDMLIVDRSLEPKNGDVAVCVIDGEFTVKRIHSYNGEITLMAENPKYKPIKVNEYDDFQVWGVVTYIIHKP
jgi:DNA polymerase V